MTAQQFSSLVGYLACRRLAFAAEGLIVGGRSKNGEVMIQEGGGAADDTVDTTLKRPQILLISNGI